MAGTPSHLQGLAIHQGVVALAMLAALWLRPVPARLRIAALMALAVADLAWVHLGHTPRAPRALIAGAPLPWAVRALGGDRASGGSRVYVDSENLDADVFLGGGPLRRRLAAGLPASRHPTELRLLHATLLQLERLTPNSGMSRGVRYLNGAYGPLQPRWHVAMDAALLDRDPALLMRLAGVDRVLTTLVPRSPRWAGPAFRELARSRELNLRVLAVDGAVPRVRLVPGARRLPAAGFAALDGPAPAPDREVLLEDADAVTAAPSTQGRARLGLRTRVPRPERYEVSVDSPYPRAFLVVGEAWYPGWEATIDGRPAPVHRADGRFMAVAVPAGGHQMTLQFHSQRLAPGIGLSVLGLLALAGLGLRRGAAQ